MLALALWAALSPASAAPDPAAELAVSLIEGARAGAVPHTWLDKHVDPGPSGWTEVTQTRWRRAFEAGGPVHTALARSAGVAHVARWSERARVVLEGVPMLSLVIDESQDPPRVVALEPTTCVQCPEPERYARDLIADIRRRGELGSRLRPGIELDVVGYVASQRGLQQQRWSAYLERYLLSSQDVADRIAGAVVHGVDGETVRVRYADGRDDTWHTTWSDRNGWAIRYDHLATNSPLRMDGSVPRAWRRGGKDRQVRFDTWRPPGRSTADGMGHVLGTAIAGAFADPRDDTALVFALDADRSLSGVFRVDPATDQVLQRVRVPTFSTRPRWGHAPWYAQWALAASPKADRVAVATPGGVFDLALAHGTSARVGRWTSEATALAWSMEGEVIVGLHDRRLVRGERTTELGTVGHPIALHHSADGLGVVTSAGEVLVLNGADVLRETTVCEGEASGAAIRERDRTWLVACGPSASVRAALVPWIEGEVFGVPGRGSPFGGVAWSPTGDMALLPDGEGPPTTWHPALDRARLQVGTEPAVRAGFSPDGDQVWTITDQGELAWWALDVLRQPRPMATTTP